MGQAFTPRIVQGLALRIEAVCAHLLDAVADQDRFEPVDASAHPLPIIVIAELPGVPPEERRLFQEWAGILFGDELGEQLAMDDLERAPEAIAPTVREMNGYVPQHIRNRRADPGDDLTSRLIAAEADGVRPEARIALRTVHKRFCALAVPSYEDVTYQNPAVILGVRRLPAEVVGP